MSDIHRSPSSPNKSVMAVTDLMDYPQSSYSHSTFNARSDQSEFGNRREEKFGYVARVPEGGSQSSKNWWWAWIPGVSKFSHSRSVSSRPSSVQFNAVPKSVPNSLVSSLYLTQRAFLQRAGSQWFLLRIGGGKLLEQPDRGFINVEAINRIPFFKCLPRGLIANQWVLSDFFRHRNWPGIRHERWKYGWSGQRFWTFCSLLC